MTTVGQVDRVRALRLLDPVDFDAGTPKLASDAPIYWAGERPGTELEWDEGTGSEGNPFLRRLFG